MNYWIKNIKIKCDQYISRFNNIIFLYCIYVCVIICIDMIIIYVILRIYMFEMNNIDDWIDSNWIKKIKIKCDQTINRFNNIIFFI